MSRVGKLPVRVPNGMSVVINNRDIVLEFGKLKSLYSVSEGFDVSYKDREISISPSSALGYDSSRFGMERSNIKNLVSGMESPFKLVLEVNGVGYKFLIDKSLILFSLGYSHDVLYRIPDGVSASFEKPNLLVLGGADKIIVGQVAAEIISFRKTEPYKGKGVKVLGKAIFRKEGKKK